jgi:hypothetical protein
MQPKNSLTKYIKLDSVTVVNILRDTCAGKIISKMEEEAAVSCMFMNFKD